STVSTAPVPDADDRSTTPCRLTATPRRWASSRDGGPVNTMPATDSASGRAGCRKVNLASSASTSSRAAVLRSCACDRSRGTRALSLSTIAKNPPANTTSNGTRLDPRDTVAEGAYTNAGPRRNDTDDTHGALPSSFADEARTHAC